MSNEAAERQRVDSLIWGTDSIQVSLHLTQPFELRDRPGWGQDMVTPGAWLWIGDQGRSPRATPTVAPRLLKLGEALAFAQILDELTYDGREPHGLGPESFGALVERWHWLLGERLRDAQKVAAQRLQDLRALRATLTGGE